MPTEAHNKWWIKKNEQVLRGLWNTIKYISICKRKISEKEKRKKGTEKKFDELMTKRFKNLTKFFSIHIYETQPNPSRLNSKKSTARPITFKLSKAKHKGKILNETREIWPIMYKGTSVTFTADFSAGKTQWHKSMEYHIQNYGKSLPAN